MAGCPLRLLHVRKSEIDPEIGIAAGKVCFTNKLYGEFWNFLEERGMIPTLEWQPCPDDPERDKLWLVVAAPQR